MNDYERNALILSAAFLLAVALVSLAVGYWFWI